MHRVIVATAAVLSVASAVHAYESPSPGLPRGVEAAPMSSGLPNFSGPGPTVLLPGDRAPQFSYLDEKGRWGTFSTLRNERSVLLLFGASHKDLAAIEDQQPGFEKLAITPIAVLDLGGRSVAAWARRHHFSGTAINDPKGVIAGLYNTVDPTTHRHAPSFFVLDERGAIRHVWHGPLPKADRLLAEAARSLGRTLNDVRMGWFE